MGLHWEGLGVAPVIGLRATAKVLREATLCKPGAAQDYPTSLRSWLLWGRAVAHASHFFILWTIKPFKLLPVSRNPGTTIPRPPFQLVVDQILLVRPVG